LKHTDPDARQEREYLTQALEVVTDQAREATRRAEGVMNEVELRTWERDLVRKQGEALVRFSLSLALSSLLSLESRKTD
jgi:hypothetical protein